MIAIVDNVENDKLPLVGVDTGGTFTDFVYFDADSGQLHTSKVLSTPDNPAQAIITGLQQLGLDDRDCRLVHGTTVGTNAVLEGRGAKVAFITNTGFADLLTLGRQNRARIYDLTPLVLTPPVPPELCIEVPVRLASDGAVIEALDTATIEQSIAQVEALQPEAIAICFLFSWQDDQHEQALARSLSKGLFISCSSQVLPSIGEYERAMTTWLNARIGGMLQDYLQHLQQQLPKAQIAVMQSSGQTIAAQLAGEQAVRLLLSGPAGGLAAVARLGELVGTPKLLSFDMGGTSTDVALVDKRPILTSNGYIGRWPVAVPMVDMHTIGAGGGSIAWLDAAGGLRVGPQSAGAVPGPACYAQGGQQPTVTDAHVVLGHIPEMAQLAGNLSLDKAAARVAFQSLADALTLSVEEVAVGVLAIANEHMARALRVMSAERGHDTAMLTLTSFGGAGGLHVCPLADQLGMRSALVPMHAGVLSALGMLLAAPGRELTRSLIQLMQSSMSDSIGQALNELKGEAWQQLGDEGIPEAKITLREQLDCRYHGQHHSITVDWNASEDNAIQQSIEQFEQLHELQNGHRLERSVELVNVRISASAQPRMQSVPKMMLEGTRVELNSQRVYGVEELVPVWTYQQMCAKRDGLVGPAVISDQLTTIWLAPGWQARADQYGNLLLNKLD